MILRELQECTPYPYEEDEQGNVKIDQSKKKWTDYYQENKKFIHKDFFKNIKDNRDFILGLNPDLVYFGSQLWDEIEVQTKSNDKPNAKQFCHYWRKIVTYSKRRKIRKIYKKSDKIEETYRQWEKLISAYEKINGQKQTCMDDYPS